MNLVIVLLVLWVVQVAAVGLLLWRADARPKVTPTVRTLAPAAPEEGVAHDERETVFLARPKGSAARRALVCVDAARAAVEREAERTEEDARCA